jgi:hypothetical protein
MVKILAYFGYLKIKVSSELEHYFIRDKEKGVKLEKEKVAGVVDKEYFNRIQSSSRFKSVGESFYLLSSGRGYQWFNGKTNYWEEPTTIVIKILLLATTVYYYSSSVKANQDVHNSFLGFGSDARIQKFQREYNNYRIAGIATGLFFGYSAIHSFIRFGRDESYKDLNIHERKFIRIDEVSERLQSINQIQFGFEFRF